MWTKLSTINALQSYKRTKNPWFLVDNALRGYRPFWLDLPHTNLHTSITPNLLHQIYAGIYKDHLKKWCQQLVGATQFDNWFKAMPWAKGTHHFSNGVTTVQMWSGQESKEMAKVLLPIVIGAINKDVVEAVRALLNFGNLVHLLSMTKEDLADMD
ncbi:hypothetical protein RhiTH_006070 [Rhizoctonia solani]